MSLEACEANKALVRRVFDEFTNAGNFDLADELFARDFVDHGAPPERAGIEGVKESLRLFRAAFPDFHYAIDDIIAEADRVHLRGTLSGTHRGMYAGIAPTGARVTWSGMDDFRIENGKIVERWAERNRVSQIGQLRGA
jgi:predicted ester cyclase